MSFLLAARVDDHAATATVDGANPAMADDGLGPTDADALDGAKHVAYACSKSVTGSSCVGGAVVETAHWEKV